jgi:hypothetical protein
MHIFLRHGGKNRTSYSFFMRLDWRREDQENIES